VVEQGTHKPLVGGSNPPSATNLSHLTDPPEPLVAALRRGAERLIPDGVPLVLAVSGGPDSMALLVAAAALAANRGWRLSVAHLDHALRPGSADEARWVADAAAELGLPAEVRRVDVAELAAGEGWSIEEAGREARYRFLEEVAAGLGADALVATAHTLDDSAETVVLNLVRGAGLSGVRGIPSRRGRIVRPLLRERRDDLRAALDQAGIRYLVDPTNEDVSFVRNRIRSEILPALGRLNPSVAVTLARYAHLAAEDDELLDALAAAELARRAKSDGWIDWHKPPARALGRRIVRIMAGDPAPSAERTEAVLDAVEGPKGGLTIELGAGRSASVRGRRLRIGR